MQLSVNTRVFATITTSRKDYNNAKKSQRAEPGGKTQHEFTEEDGTHKF
jgi:hypothetical protein